jgi:hypothetical protein
MRKNSNGKQRSCIATRRMPHVLSRFCGTTKSHNAPGNPPQHGGFACSGMPIIGEALKFEQVGRYRAGETEREIPLGTLYLAAMRSLRTGWARWRDDQPVAIISGLVGAGFKPPTRADLGDVDPARWDYPERDPWQKFSALVLLNLQVMKPVTFIAATAGDMGAVGLLCRAYSRQGLLKLPVVRLQAISSRSQGMLRICYPWFQIIGWAGGDDAEDAPTPRGDVPVSV